MKRKLNLLMVMLVLLGISCSNNDGADQNGILGLWELAKLENGTDGVKLPPNDGKPVQLNFKDSGNYNGDAGNNKIHGSYRIEDGKLILTMATTEVVNTEWESMFKGAMEEFRNVDEYILPFTLEGNELVLEYDEHGKMTLIKI